MSWFLTFAGLAVLIILHEFGHFSVAKAVGMRVERFSLFFPPHLVKARWGETEYAIGAIPLGGGYVKITGMNPQEEVPPEVAPRSYFRQPPWKRIAVIAAGPGMNLLIAFVVFWAIFLSQGYANGKSTFKVGVVEAHQAATGVLQPGDQIVSVDERQGSLKFVSQQISSHRCAGAPTPGCTATTPVRLTIRRHSRLLTLSILPRYDPVVKRTRIGFAFGEQVENVGPLRAVSLSVTQMWDFTDSTVSGLVKAFYNSKTRSQVHTIVGISQVAQQEVSYGVVQAFGFLAIFSLILAVINLFPFLPLDGGHIFWALAEKIRGRAVPARFIQQWSAVGIVLIAFLFITGLSNDINSLQNGGLHAPR